MADLLHAFGVEWHVLIVQIVNVGILVYVLQRFAFKPLLKAIDARREKIAEDELRAKELEERLANIETREAEVLHAARAKSETIIQEGIAAGKQTAEKIGTEARAEAVKIIESGKKILADDRAKLVREVKSEIGSLVAEAVEKTVAGSYSKPIEEKMISEALSYVKSHEKKIS